MDLAERTRETFRRRPTSLCFLVTLLSCRHPRSHAAGEHPDGASDTMSEFVNVGKGVRLAVFRRDARDPRSGSILAVHGGPGIVSSSFGSILDISMLGFDATWFAQRGVPPSPQLEIGYGLDDYVADIRAIADVARRHRPFVVVAFSFGALPSVQAFSDGLDADGLVLVSPAPPDWRANMHMNKLAESQAAWMDAMGELPFGWREWPFCEAASARATVLDVPPQAFARLSLACSERSAKSTSRSMRGYDVTAAFAKIVVPVLVVRGDRDLGGRVRKFEDLPAREMATRVLAGCGHAVLSDQRCRSALFAAIEAWAGSGRLRASRTLRMRRRR